MSHLYSASLFRGGSNNGFILKLSFSINEYKIEFVQFSQTRNSVNFHS